MSILDSYRGQSIALPTLHQKGALIAPSFLTHLGMTVVEIDVDTDQFGSFAGEVKREGSQLDTARSKALLGAQVSGLDFAIASEGSIGADPEIGLLTSDIETIVFIDRVNNLEIIENYRSFDITAQKIEFTEEIDLDQFLVKADFPRHKLIVRSDFGLSNVIAKGIATKSELMSAIAQAREQAIDPIVIESDLRAHCSPTRAKNIEITAERLAKKIASLCPNCATPGWGAVEPLFGLLCRECGEESENAPRSYLYGCLKCTHTAEGEVIAESLDPSRCNWCNP